MDISTRRAVRSDYQTLSDMFGAASREYQSLRPDFYRSVNSMPSQGLFNLLCVAKKLGLKQDIEMIVATDELDSPIGAVYVESVKRTPRSWSAFEKMAWIETLVIPSKNRSKQLEDTLIRAGKNWAKETGHPYLSVKDIAVFKAHEEAYERAGIKPDYTIFGCHL